jgi:hypothetical protein
MRDADLGRGGRFTLSLTGSESGLVRRYRAKHPEFPIRRPSTSTSTRSSSMRAGSWGACGGGSRVQPAEPPCRAARWRRFRIRSDDGIFQKLRRETFCAQIPN